MRYGRDHGLRDLDCYGDYDEDDARPAMADFGITEGGDSVPGDGDGEVDGADLSYVLGYWGLCSAP